MKLSGSYTFSAPREEVWELLNDPATLQRIIPGCERLEQTGENTYAANMKIGLAGVKGDYTGTITISDQQPPERYRLHGDGRGKPGFAKGTGNVELVAEPDGRTTMRYTGEAQVGGPVAGIGQRLIEGAAKSIINQGLKALSAELEARHGQSNGTGNRQPEAAALDSSPAPAAQAAPASEAGAPESGSSYSAPASGLAYPPAAWSSTGLSTSGVMRGMAEDLLAEQPWVRWALPLAGGFALGLLAGLSIGRAGH